LWYEFLKRVLLFYFFIETWQHYVFCNSGFMPARQVRAISAFPTTPSAMLAASFANVERHINLCLQAQGNQYHHLL
jgi:hypothetical protein